MMKSGRGGGGSGHRQNKHSDKNVIIIKVVEKGKNIKFIFLILC